MEDRVKEAFGKIWPMHVHQLNNFLIRCRRAFDGDLDLFLVLAVIGECTYSPKHADPERDFETFRGGHLADTKPINVNIRSIAEYSGIPRETVRRKIAELERRGWVNRSPDDYLTATRQASTDLEPLTLASIQYLSGMMKMLQALETGGSDPSTP